MTLIPPSCVVEVTGQTHSGAGLQTKALEHRDIPDAVYKSADGIFFRFDKGRKYITQSVLTSFLERAGLELEEAVKLW